MLFNCDTIIQKNGFHSDALKSYTFGPAFGTFREHELGTIEEGKLADLVVLDRNLLEIHPEEIKDASVLMTICDGRIVYSKQKAYSQN